MKPNMLTCGRIELRANTFASHDGNGDCYMTKQDYEEFIQSVRKDLDPQLALQQELETRCNRMLDKCEEILLKSNKNKKSAQSVKKTKKRNVTAVTK